MKNLKCLLLASFLLFLVLSGLNAQTAKKLYKIPVTQAKMKVDGVLEEEEWENALKLTLNYEVDPGENIAPPVKTEVFLAYDSKHLHVGFKAHDPDPSAIRAHLTDRDNIANDDYVGIVLDTFNDSRLAHSLSCNPYGIQADHISSITSGTIAWDAIWDSAGRITEDGYCTEMAIPFTSLRFQGKKGDQEWGIDAIRSYPRSVLHTLGLFPRDKGNNCYMCQAIKMTGFSGARPGKNLEFDPTISAISTQEREDYPEGKFIDTRKKVEPGLTARWSFTPNLTLNATVNPDFSQVEADTAQLDINTQFALFYPEKRPFFLEGSNIFLSSRFYVVHTRTVAEPEWGVKLSGKEGKHALAFFTARDTVTNLILPSSQSSRYISLDMKNLSSALRYRLDIGGSSNLGFFLTDREGENYHNRLVGIDTDIRFSKADHLALQYLGSQTRYPEEVTSTYNQPDDQFYGSAFEAYYAHRTRTFFFYGNYQLVSPDFRADVGHIDRTGTKFYQGGGSYTWRKPPGHWYTTIILGTGYVYLTDYNNQLLQKYFRVTMNYLGPLQSLLVLRMDIGKRTYLGREFNYNIPHFKIELRPVGNLHFGLWGYLGDQVDYINVRNGKRLRMNPFVRCNLGRHIYLGVDHLYEKLTVDDGRLYTANLTNFTAVYQLNRRAFFRAVLQYADYDYNSDLYISPRDPEQNALFSQFLFSYKINPQTVLFLGYSDDYLGFSNIPLTQTNRTFFLKIGYALVL